MTLLAALLLMAFIAFIGYCCCAMSGMCDDEQERERNEQNR